MHSLVVILHWNQDYANISSSYKDMSYIFQGYGLYHMTAKKGNHILSDITQL